MRSGFQSAVAVTVGLVLGGLSPSLLSADSGTGGGDTTPEQALETDAASYADDFKLTVAEAKRRLVLLEDLKRLADATRDAVPDRFAGAWIEHAPEYRLVIRLAGPEAAPIPVDSILAASPVPTVIMTGANQTLDELLAGLRRLDPVLASSFPEVSSKVDVRSGALVLGSPTGLPDDTVAALQQLAGVPTRAEVAAPFQLLHTYGGRKVTFSDTGDCTTGFTVRNTGTGVYGVTTAAHCGNSGIQYYETSTSHYPMTFMGQRWDNDQDAEWLHESSHTVYPKFWDGSSYRWVTGRESVSNMLGDYVCHYGIGSGYSCGIIDDTSFDPGNICGPTGLSDCYSSWIHVADSGALKCSGGDSGGPFFVLGVAYGTTQAGLLGATPSDCGGMTFMQTEFLVTMSLAVYIHVS
jgi:hypothetical protein